jgi:hypothetical protein
MRISLALKKPNFHLVQRKLFYVWIRHYKLLFFFTFLVITVIAGFQWYQDLYAYQWSENERRAYLDSTAKETAFQEEKFREILSLIERDSERHRKPIEIERDLFAGARERTE